MWISFEQRDTNGLTAENSELKLRLQTMEQQVHLQDGNGFCFLVLIASISSFNLESDGYDLYMGSSLALIQDKNLAQFQHHYEYLTMIYV